MTATERSPVPVRPREVPADAEWHPELREWLSGTRDETGRWQGEVVGYRADGTRASLQNFEEGELDGASLRFHPNGEVAHRARYVEGKPEGEVRRTGSSAPTPERLRSCCVPATAWSLVERYDAGLLLDQWFEDEHGRRLLSDGTVRPQRPSAVPAEARFDEGSRRWVEGESVLRVGRQGLWRWWSEVGDLIEECEFAAGRPSGRAAVKRVAPGTFADAAIAAWAGHFDAGQRCGNWRFFDREGALLHDVDFGTPCPLLEQEHPLLASSADELLVLSRQLMDSGAIGLGLCALARHAARTGEFHTLSASLRAHTVPLSPAVNQRRSVEIRRQKEISLATWVQALVDGIEPAQVFSNLAMLLLDRPNVGFDFAVAAVEINPDESRFRLTRALLAYELGDPTSAFREAERLEDAQPAAARLVRDYRRILFSPLVFRASEYAPETPPNPELPGTVGQPLERIRRVIAKYALRLTKLRTRLIELCGSEAEWLPPDVSELCDDSVELESYSFEERDDEAADEDAAEREPRVEVIRVDETLTIDALGITALLRRARVEWTGLCWLCWGAGLDSVSVPEVLGERADFAAVLASSLFRVFRVSDSMQTRGLRSRSQHLPSTTWEGSDVDSLDNLFVGMARDEAFEMRAALFFLADEFCRSPWQDDLREG